VNYNSLIRVKIKVRDFSRAMPRFAQPDPGDLRMDAAAHARSCVLWCRKTKVARHRQRCGPKTDKEESAINSRGGAYRADCEIPAW